MWNVYILKSTRKDWYYVGSTNDINRRLKEHNSNKVLSTKAYSPYKIVYIMSCSDEKEARSFEHKIKKQRLLKEEIIRNIDK